MSILIEDQNSKIKTLGVTYRDLNLNRNNNTKSDSVSVEDVAAVRSAMVNLLSIKRGSRLLDPTFGNNIDEFLFEQISESNGRMLGEEIEETLLQETRIVVQEVVVIVDKPNGTYNVGVHFAIPTLSKRDLSLNLELKQNGGINIVL